MPYNHTGVEGFLITCKGFLKHSNYSVLVDECFQCSVVKAISRIMCRLLLKFLPLNLHLILSFDNFEDILDLDWNCKTIGF